MGSVLSLTRVLCKSYSFIVDIQKRFSKISFSVFPPKTKLKVLVGRQAKMIGRGLGIKGIIIITASLELATTWRCSVVPVRLSFPLGFPALSLSLSLSIYLSLSLSLSLSFSLSLSLSFSISLSLCLSFFLSFSLSLSLSSFYILPLPLLVLHSYLCTPLPISFPVTAFRISAPR